MRQAAHDIRSPFQGLFGLLQVLRDDWQSLPAEDVTDFLGQCFAAAETSLAQIEKLANLAHNDKRLLWGDAVAVTWLDLWRRATSRLWPQLNAVGMTLPSLPVADDLPHVQVVTALAQGAIAHLLELHLASYEPNTARNITSTTLHVQAHHDEEQQVVTVSVTGLSLSPNEHENATISGDVIEGSALTVDGRQDVSGQVSRGAVMALLTAAGIIYENDEAGFSLSMPVAVIN